MHQHPRVPPAAASPARSPQTNPMRSNNPRDALAMHSRQNSENSQTPSEQGIFMTERAPAASSSSKEESASNKLDLIIQNYFYKAALTILDARIPLPQAFTSKEREPRVNRWFNIEINETLALSEHTRRWRTAGAVQNRPPDMVIETYIDLQDLSSNQKLVILDDYGKRWDVETAFRDAYDGYDAPGEQLRQHSIVLERWTMKLDQAPTSLETDYEKKLPIVYKTSIILYRCLFAYLRMMPGWKFFKRGSKGVAGQPMPKLKWRIYDPARRPNDGRPDDLTLSLFAGQPQVTEQYAWDPLDSPAGRFSIEVSYRNNCDFRIETPESLFNDQFMAHDEQLFEPSLPQSGVFGSRRGPSKPKPTEMGSLPTDSRQLPTRKKLDEITEQGPAYGSMSTFHNAGGRIGTSPLSALRAARELYGKSPQDSPPQTTADSGQNLGSNASLLSNQAAPGMARRTSISFNPFKTPAFSSSVPVDSYVPASPRVSSSINRPSPLGPLTEARRPSQGSQAQLSPRESPLPADAVPVPVSSSPRPAPTRFSSSFSHRKNRPSIGGASSRTEDDNSSGRGSVSSSNAQTIGPTGEATSGNPPQTDDESLADFLKMLEQRKELKSFTKPKPASAASGSQALRGTTAGLSRFQHMRDSHVALSDSISSSQMLQRSSVSSASRQLANVPPMIGGTSASLSSSPGERMSPRTPHTPAIPSRLSSNSIIEYNQDARRPRGHRYSTGEDVSLQERAEESDATALRDAGAIPIPNSPRFGPQYRRSSSAANNHNRDRARADRYTAVENYDDILPFALRSASMGDGEEREPLSLSALLRMQDTSGPIITGVLPPSTELDDDMDTGTAAAQDTAVNRGSMGRSMSYRGRGHGRVSSLAHEERTPASTASSSASRPGTGRSGSGSMEGRPPGRHSFMRSYGNANFEDDEPLLFAMSEQLEGSGGAPGGGSGSGSGSGRGRLAQW